MSMSTGGQGINFSGLASGLDSNSLIGAMVAVRHQRIDQVVSQQATLNNHKTLYSNVMSALQALNITALGMDSRLDFGPMQATTTNSDVLTAAAGSGAAAGTYSVKVDQVATAQRTYSNGVSSASAPLDGQFGNGTVTLQYGDKPAQSFAIDPSTTLQSMADSINNMGLGVTATVVNEGGQVRLALNGADTGAKNAFSITEDGTTTGLSQEANTAQKAQDARLVVDGFTTISRPTNTINDAIGGVTLQVRSANSTAQTLRIGVDAAGVENQIQDFVNGYNNVVSAINTATAFRKRYDPNQLTGDPTLRDLTMQLQHMVTTPVRGSGSDYRTLAEIGITTQKDGTLALDSKKLQKALAADYQGVSRLFIKDPTSGTQGVAASLEALQKKYTDFFEGSITRAIKGITGQVDKMTEQMDGMQRNLDAYQQSLQYKFNTLETTMSRLKSQGAYLGSLQQAQSNTASRKR